MLCESRFIRTIHLAIGRNGSYGNAALKLKTFFFIKNPLEINLNQITIKSLVFRLTGSTTIASAFCTLWGKEQLAVKLPDDFSAKNHRASWCSWFFRLKFALGLLRELLYSNETLEHWPRGTFATLSAKEWNVTETNTCSYPFLT